MCACDLGCRNAQVVRALHTNGLAEARLLLQDWLCLFVQRCHTFSLAEASTRGKSPSSDRFAVLLVLLLVQRYRSVNRTAEDSLSSLVSRTAPVERRTWMQPLLRAIYGLLHRPLLEFETDEDSRVAEELYLWCVR